MILEFIANGWWDVGKNLIANGVVCEKSCKIPVSDYSFYVFSLL